MDLTRSGAGYFALILFGIAYAAVMAEEALHLRKSKPVLVAAGMGLAWKKIQALSSIEAWQYHNWIDNRGEGGLRIGLRKFPDEPGDPLGKKPIWQLYQALGTPHEDKACAPYLPVMGLRSWKSAIHRDIAR